MSCHSLDGTKRIGPSFADLWTRTRMVSRGGKSEEVAMSEAYIRKSLLSPQAAIVQGYEQANKMINIQETLTEKQIDALVNYLIELKLNHER
jgi:cytochrome c oxidase subunit II